MKVLSKIASSLFVLTIISLFLYSYTQVDLSLTLSRMSLWQVIEKAFQYIGYFQRPLSTGLYISILLLMYFCYVCFLIAIHKKQYNRKTIWSLILFTAVLLTFSYNAFSYDLFNYIFDAKIVTHYFQNPYIHKALDFPQDPMLSFMHWTQRTYPYGPIWLLITVPISFIGLQIFLPTLFLFKAIGSVSYVVTCLAIEKILKKTDPQNSLLGLGIFAFSPLVLVEGLVSAHNDMAMVVLATLSLLFLLNKKYVWSFLVLFLSIGIKFATAMLLPLWVIWLFIKKKEQATTAFFFISFLFLIVPVIFATLRTNFQPWYILFLFPFAALLPRRIELVIGFTFFSLAILLQYIPFLYTGNWNPPIPQILEYMLWLGLGISIAVSFCTLVGQIFIAKKK